MCAKRKNKAKYTRQYSILFSFKMALRSRLNRGKRQNERDLPGDEGGSRRTDHDQEQNESTEVEHESNDRSNTHTHNREDTESSRDTSKDKSRDVIQDKDNKSETTGRSIASRFRRNKKPAEEKPTDEEQEPLNGGFGDRDRDRGRDRNGDDKDRESRTHGENGSKATAGGRHSGDGNADGETHQDDVAGGKNNESNQLEKDLELGPLRVLQPIRTDPVMQLKTRHKKMERLTAEFVPEIHIIGNILSGTGIIQEESEGASCRYILPREN